MHPQTKQVLDNMNDALWKKYGASDFALRSLCFPVSALQDDVTRQIIEEAALKLQQLPCSSEQTCLVTDMANKLLPVLEDAKFSSLWVVLLDKLSALSHEMEVLAVYSHLDEKQAQIFTHGSIPLPVIHRLWLTHLPSLECAILMLVKQLCCDRHFVSPAMISNILNKSGMMKVNPTFPEGIQQLEALLRTSPETLPPSSVVSMLQKMHEIWTNMSATAETDGVNPSTEIRKPTAQSHHPLAKTPDHSFEMLWSLIVQYKEWIVAALDNILSCSHQYVESCLWVVTVYQRINMHSPEMKAVKTSLIDFISTLRDELEAPIVTTDTEIHSLVNSLMTSLGHAKGSDTPLSKGQKESHRSVVQRHRSVVNQLLMVFLFQSTAGISLGSELLALAAGSSDLSDHIKCFIYHFQALSINPKVWSHLKCNSFVSFVSDLHLRLENDSKINGVQEFEDVLKELKTLLEHADVK